MNQVNIATYADHNYIQHACVLLMSLKDVISPSRRYRVFIFYSNCDEKGLKKLRESLDKNMPSNVTYEVLSCKGKRNHSLKAKNDHQSAAIYNKIFIYDELPSDIEKIVFLDADIVLLKDPAEIYDLEIGDCVVAAVKEPVFEILPEIAQKTIGVEKGQYFNSGVMLVNLMKWHSLNISQRALDFCIDHWNVTPYHDQDAFNHIINGNWREISPLWNPRIKNKVLVEDRKEQVLSKNEVYKKDLSYLVHYSGPGKPWFYMSFHPKKQIYLHYLSKTEFSDFKFPDYSAVNVVKKWVLKIRRKIYYLRHSCPPSNPLP